MLYTFPGGWWVWHSFTNYIMWPIVFNIAAKFPILLEADLTGGSGGGC